MKYAKILSLLLCLAMVVSALCTSPFIAFADEAAVTITGSDDPSAFINGTSGVANNFHFVNLSNMVSQGTEPIGGKNSGDSYAVLDGASSSDPLIRITPTADDMNCEYYVVSLNVYGNTTPCNMYQRVSSSVKPYIATVAASNFIAGRWNNIMFVYKKTGTLGYAYVNGVKIGGTNLTAEAAKQGGTFTTLTDLRIVFSKTEIKVDDVWACKTDVEPVPVFGTISTDGDLYKNQITVSESGAAVSASDGDINIYSDSSFESAVEDSHVSNGNCVVVSKSSPYGNTYNYFTVSTDTTNNLIGYWNDGGHNMSGSADGFASAAHGSVVWSESGANGKAADDKYGVVTIDNANKEARIIHGLASSQRYIVMTAQILPYSDSGLDRVFFGTNQNAVISWENDTDGIKNGYFTVNKWNTFSTIYDMVDKKAYNYVNGKLCQVASEKIADLSSVESPRIQLHIFGAAGKTVGLDNVLFYQTNKMPDMSDYPSVTEKPGYYVVGSDICIPEGKTLTYGDLTINGTANAFKDDTYSEELASDTAFENGNAIVVNKDNTVSMDNGVSYTGTNVAYYTIVTDYQIKNVLATLDSGFSNMYNYPDPTGENASWVDTDDVMGSGITMKKITVGTRGEITDNTNGNGTQAYYQANWNKAGKNPPRYLVLEADMAFDDSKTMLLSTSTGTNIGGLVSNSYAYANRIFHYVWVYDTVTKMYTSYVNGDIIAEKEIDSGFANGTKTDIRIGFSDCGKSGYIANLCLYESIEAPAIAAPAKIANEYVTYSTAKDDFTLADAKAAAEAKGCSLRAFADNTYSTEIQDDNAVLGVGSMLVASKDGLYDYARVCKLPSESADYAVETLNITDDGDGKKIYVNVINYAEQREMTVILAEYNQDGVASVKYNNASVNKYGGISSTITVSPDNRVELFVWDSFAGLRPLDIPVIISGN